MAGTTSAPSVLRLITLCFLATVVSCSTCGEVDIATCTTNLPGEILQVEYASADGRDAYLILSRNNDSLRELYKSTDRGCTWESQLLDLPNAMTLDERTRKIGVREIVLATPGSVQRTVFFLGFGNRFWSTTGGTWGTYSYHSLSANVVINAPSEDNAASAAKERGSNMDNLSNVSLDRLSPANLAGDDEEGQVSVVGLSSLSPHPSTGSFVMMKAVLATNCSGTSNPLCDEEYLYGVLLSSTDSGSTWSYIDSYVTEAFWLGDGFTIGYISQAADLAGSGSSQLVGGTDEEEAAVQRFCVTRDLGVSTSFTSMTGVVDIIPQGRDFLFLVSYASSFNLVVDTTDGDTTHVSGGSPVYQLWVSWSGSPFREASFPNTAISPLTGISVLSPLSQGISMVELSFSDADLDGIFVAQILPFEDEHSLSYWRTLPGSAGLLTVPLGLDSAVFLASPSSGLSDEGSITLSPLMRTSNKGNSWSPSRVAGCTEGDCSFLLARGSEVVRPWDETSSFYLSLTGSAGVLLATGSGIGEDVGGYATYDGGATWQPTIPGAHIFAASNNGDLFVAASDAMSLSYSWTQGHEWHSCAFGNNLGSNTTLASLGRISDSLDFFSASVSPSTSIFTVFSFVSATPTECVGLSEPDEADSDYETWSPSGECYQGSSGSFLRRKPSAPCRVTYDYARYLPSAFCPCMREDYWCDGSSYAVDDQSSDFQCYLEPGSEAGSLPADCPASGYAEVSRGYLLTPGNLCEGGIDLSAQDVFCGTNSTAAQEQSSGAESYEWPTDGYATALSGATGQVDATTASPWDTNLLIYYSLFGCIVVGLLVCIVIVTLVAVGRMRAASAGGNLPAEADEDHFYDELDVE